MRPAASSIPSFTAWLLLAALFSAECTAENRKQKFARQHPEMAKIDAHLRPLLADAPAANQLSVPATPYVRRAMSNSADTGMPVAVQLDNGSGLEDFLIAEGLELSFLSQSREWATVNIASPSDLETLASWPGVRRVLFSPRPLRRVGAVTSRAPRAMNAIQTQQQFNVDGSGYAIGILSDSFAQTQEVRDGNTTPAQGASGVLQGSRPQDTGDLPPLVRILKDTDSQGVDEGAAMAELVHDVVPGAEIVFHAVGDNRAEMADAIGRLCSEGVDVLVDDILFLTESAYQDDLIAIAIEDCVASGKSYFAAAGNDADFGYRYVFKDINPGIDEAGEADVPSGNDLHNWSENQQDAFLAVTLGPNASIYAVLAWNQPNESVNRSRGAQVDLDLYVVANPTLGALNPLSANFYASSVSHQGTTGQPAGDAVEFVLMETGFQSRTFYLAVDHFDGLQDGIPQSPETPLEFRLLLTGEGDILATEYVGNGPTVWGHAAAKSAVSVAAVPWWESPQFAPTQYDTVAIDPESFSSRGGVIRHQFDASGNFQISNRTVPSIAGIDGNNNTVLGVNSTQVAAIDGEPDDFRNFFGTSAAAPNVAAAFILLKSAFSEFPSENILEAIFASAIDVTGFRASVGVDDVTGPGLIDIDGAAILLGGLEPPPPQEEPVSPPNAGSTGGSSGNSGGGGGGCFIATAAFGSYMAPDVMVLRQFRDRVLLKSRWGESLVRTYYRYSPPIARLIAESEGLKLFTRGLLLPLIYAVKYPLVALYILCAMVLGSSVLLAQRRIPR